MMVVNMFSNYMDKTIEDTLDKLLLIMDWIDTESKRKHMKSLLVDLVNKNLLNMDNDLENFVRGDVDD